jgi:phosphoglycolate phosphatase-like HAD superfamily hydrolase
MRFDFDKCRCILFDCDGVILDSNRIKSEAFRCVALRFGADTADRFVRYHQQHGGVSRYRKFAHLLEELSPVPAADRDALLAELLREYSARCAEGLLHCALIPGVKHFLAAMPPEIAAYVVTGGDQAEVRNVFSARGLDHYFREVLGSPVGKREHMQTLAERGVFAAPSLYFGDAELDMRLAAEFSLDFIFVHGASEWPAGNEECRGNRIADFRELL